MDGRNLVPLWCVDKLQIKRHIRNKPLNRAAEWDRIAAAEGEI